MGFLDSGKDVSGLIATLYTNLIYSSLIGVFPELIRPTYPMFNWFTPAREYLFSFAQNQIADKKATFSTDASQGGPTDMITKMFHTQTEKETFSSYFILERVMGNIVAGSDT